MKTKWCCIGFKSSWDAAGDRGFSILVDREDDPEFGPQFVLQHRAADVGADFDLDTDFPVSLVSQLQLVHCPWCGRRLARWYRAWIDELVRPDLLIRER